MTIYNLPKAVENSTHDNFAYLFMVSNECGTRMKKQYHRHQVVLARIPLHAQDEMYKYIYGHSKVTAM